MSFLLIIRGRNVLCGYRDHHYSCRFESLLSLAICEPGCHHGSATTAPLPWVSKVRDCRESLFLLKQPSLSMRCHGGKAQQGWYSVHLSFPSKNPLGHQWSLNCKELQDREWSRCKCHIMGGWRIDLQNFSLGVSVWQAILLSFSTTVPISCSIIVFNKVGSLNK